MKTAIPVPWSNFWSSHKRFPRLVDLTIEEDHYTFCDDGVTLFTDEPLRPLVNKDTSPLCCFAYRRAGPSITGTDRSLTTRDQALRT